MGSDVLSIPLAGHHTAWLVRLTSKDQRYSQSVHRASHPLPTSIQDMGIDHGGLHVLVAEQLLDGSQIGLMANESFASQVTPGSNRSGQTARSDAP